VWERGGWRGVGRGGGIGRGQYLVEDEVEEVKHIVLRKNDFVVQHQLELLRVFHGALAEALVQLLLRHAYAEHRVYYIVHVVLFLLRLGLVVAAEVHGAHSIPAHALDHTADVPLRRLDKHGVANIHLVGTRSNDPTDI
jgi:hypothetical protein